MSSQKLCPAPGTLPEAFCKDLGSEFETWLGEAALKDDSYRPARTVWPTARPVTHAQNRADLLEILKLRNSTR